MIDESKMTEQIVPQTLDEAQAWFNCTVFEVWQYGASCARRHLRAVDMSRPKDARAWTDAKMGLAVCATCPAGAARAALEAHMLPPPVGDMLIPDPPNHTPHRFVTDVGSHSGHALEEVEAVDPTETAAPVGHDDTEEEEVEMPKPTQEGTCARCSKSYRTTLATADARSNYCGRCRQTARHAVERGTAKSEIEYLQGMPPGRGRQPKASAAPVPMTITPVVAVALEPCSTILTARIEELEEETAHLEANSSTLQARIKELEEETAHLSSSLKIERMSEDTVRSAREDRDKALDEVLAARIELRTAKAERKVAEDERDLLVEALNDIIDRLAQRAYEHEFDTWRESLTPPAGDLLAHSTQS